MNRRSLLQCLAAIPFVGPVLAPKRFLIREVNYLYPVEWPVYLAKDPSWSMPSPFGCVSTKVKPNDPFFITVSNMDEAVKILNERVDCLNRLRNKNYDIVGEYKLSHSDNKITIVHLMDERHMFGETWESYVLEEIT